MKLLSYLRKLSERREERRLLEDLERQKREVHEEFELVKAEASAQGGMVCGTFLRTGRPVYFVMPKDAPPDAIEARAFELREGRKITPGELTLKELAEKRMGRVLDA